MLDWHQTDPGRIATFWAYDPPSDPGMWIAEKRLLGREYVSKYIKVKPGITSTVDSFALDHFQGHFVFGAHIRGTDFAYAEPTPPEDYFSVIDTLSRELRLESFRVFLATDQVQYVERFRRVFGENLLVYDAHRSSGDVAPFRSTSVSPYKKGEDVLVDALLLARCNHILKCAAALGEFALWFNHSDSVSDFALRSSFENVADYRLESAFLKLNVDNDPAWKIMVRRRWRIFIRYLWGARSTAALIRRVPHRWRPWIKRNIVSLTGVNSMWH